MVVRKSEAPHITIGTPPAWLIHNGVPRYRVIVSHGGVTRSTDLDLEADVVSFRAGARLGFTKRDPDLLRRAELKSCAEYDQIRREGILVGLIMAGVALPPITHPEETPHSLSCEEVGD